MAETTLTVSSEALQRLLAAANGDAALLYLYLASDRPLEEAAQALRMSQARYDLACATLQQLGLWPQEPQRHLDAAQAPVYTEQDVIRESRASREFEAITGETQRRLGRVLSNEELKILLSIYRYLGLPGEVIENAAAVWGAHVHEDYRAAFLESNQEITDGRTTRHCI